jgi:hypothetical protein
MQRILQLSDSCTANDSHEDRGLQPKGMGGGRRDAPLTHGARASSGYSAAACPSRFQDPSCPRRPCPRLHPPPCRSHPAAAAAAAAAKKKKKKKKKARRMRRRRRKRKRSPAASRRPRTSGSLAGCPRTCKRGRPRSPSQAGNGSRAPVACLEAVAAAAVGAVAVVANLTSVEARPLSQKPLPRSHSCPLPALPPLPPPPPHAGGAYCCL